MEQAVNWLPTAPHTVDTPCGTFDGCSVDFESVCRGAVFFSAAIEHVGALFRRVPWVTWQMAGGGCTNRTCRGSFRARVPPGRPVVGLRQALPSMCAVPQVVNAGKIGKILIQRDEATHQCARWLLGLCERHIAQPFRSVPPGFRPKLFYSKLPDDIASSFVFLLDPMMAERVLSLSPMPDPLHQSRHDAVCAGGGRCARRTEHERSTTVTGVPCYGACIRAAEAQPAAQRRTLQTAGSAICAMEVRMRQGRTRRRLRLSSRFSLSRALNHLPCSGP
jgi:hypothetical protein